MLDNYLEIINRKLDVHKLGYKNQILDGVNSVLLTYKGRLLKSFPQTDEEGILNFLDGFYSAL